jgi:nicotinamide-nucleotide amidase
MSDFDNPLKLEIIAVGDEILLGRCREDNARHISREFSSIGIEPARITVLPDDRATIAGEMAKALERSDVVLVTGGLGPTIDDVTRGAAIDALGGETDVRREVTDAIKARYGILGKPVPVGYRDHAVVPRGADILPNALGAAVGIKVVREGRELYLLPGVPAEMKDMLRMSVLPLFADRSEDSILTIRTFGLPEAEVEERLRGLLEPGQMDALSIISGITGVDCYIKAGAWSDETRAAISAVLGSCVYATTGESMEEVCLRMLREGGATVSTAESVTGGLLASRIVAVPGASFAFHEGFVTYSNESKISRLGVASSSIERFGAVSSLVCVEMAQGARERAGTDFGLSTTGIAGPEGATLAKPRGLCFVGLSTPSGAYCQKALLAGDRTTVRGRASSLALNLLRLELGGYRDDLEPHRYDPR